MTRLALFVVAALALSACANEALIDEVERAPTGEILHGGRLGTTRLVAGDCFNERSGSVVRSVNAVPCSEPHRGQVMGRALAEPRYGWPGAMSLAEEAGPLCKALAGEVLSGDLGELADLPRLDLSAYVPDEPAWEDGDRAIVCWIEAAEPITLDLRSAIAA
jgi:hypothetical protein